MTAKRSSSSLVPLSCEDGLSRSTKEPKICSAVSPQSSETIVLDDLVMERCISMLHYMDRMFHERVNHRLANMLHYSYGKTVISLTIMGTFAFCGPIQRSPLARKREAIFAKEKQVPLALRLIFKRFKRIKCLKICAANMKYVMETMLDSLCYYDYQPTDIRRLHLYFDDMTICKNSCRVIAIFAHILKELVIDASCMVSEKHGERFWSTVANCSNLRKLAYNPEYDMYGTTDFVKKCLRELKMLTSFSTGKNIEFGKSQWLMDCFSASPNLRNLSIANCYRSPTFTFSALAILPLYTRLKTVALHFNKPQSQLHKIAADIMKILHALPADGFLTVTQTDCGHLDYELIRKYCCVEVEAAMAQVLYFWLSMSERSKRRVKLSLCFYDESFYVIDPLFKRIIEWKALKDEQFNGLSIIRLNGGTRLRLKNAQVQLTTHRVSDDDMSSVVRI